MKSGWLKNAAVTMMMAFLVGNSLLMQWQDIRGACNVIAA